MRRRLHWSDGVRLRGLAVAGCVGALAWGAAACGGGGNGGAGTLDIYSSLPQQGAAKDRAAAIVDGIRLALDESGGKAGDWTIKYEALDDSTAQAGRWDPGATARAARTAALDPDAVGYIGELDWRASAISIPILNQAGIAQVSPANTHVGLTTDEPGAERGEPDKYYPTGTRTFLRIVPRDTVQAAALLTLMRQDGCRRVAIAHDEDAYGAGMAREMELQAPRLGVDIVANVGVDPAAPGGRSPASTIKEAGADCFVFSGVTSGAAVAITEDVAAALPGARLYGPDGVCAPAFTNPARDGIPKAIAPRFRCTKPTLSVESYPGGQRFLRSFRQKYGNANPDPSAIYGYEAMRLFIDTIAGLGDRGDDKQAVLDALLATKDRDSVLGRYSFDENGDTSLTDYGVYRVGADGTPRFSETVRART